MSTRCGARKLGKQNPQKDKEREKRESLCLKSTEGGGDAALLSRSVPGNIWTVTREGEKRKKQGWERARTEGGQKNLLGSEQKRKREYK